MAPDSLDMAPRPGAILVQDLQQSLPLSSILTDGDLLYVLSPATLPMEPSPPSGSATDPFEPFGLALAKHHPWIRHIPYMVRDGITAYHANHLQLARAVVFVITGPPCAGQPSQVALARIAQSMAPDRPQIVLACCSLRDLGALENLLDLFPTLVETPDYSSRMLTDAADLLFFPPTQLSRLSGGLPDAFGLDGQSDYPRTGHRRSARPQGLARPPSRPESINVAAAVPAPVPVSVSASTTASPHQTSYDYPAYPSAPVSERTRWSVREWDVLRDPPAIHQLWSLCMPSRFHVDMPILQGLLDRPGYSKHFVVRDPRDGEAIGFCATYTSFIDNSDNSWIGCLATVMVHPSHRRRGIGTSLHSHAIRQLTEHRVSRLQLGTTFPRLLYGLPVNDPAESWFRRRGWRIDSLEVPGCGQEACDWILDLENWRADGLAPGGLLFRQCEFTEYDLILEFVARESVRKGNVGWYDQYYQLAGTMNIRDILVCQEGPTIVATALTYLPFHGGRANEDLPWAATISNTVGGVTCICITDDHLSFAHTRDSVMIRLLNYCVCRLREQGMTKMFLDAVRGGEEGFMTIGFEKWARYRDVWREA